MSDREGEPIGQVIRRARERRGLSQHKLADALNMLSGKDTVTGDRISRYERGIRIPWPHTRELLSEALGLSRGLLDRAADVAKAHRLLNGDQ